MINRDKASKSWRPFGYWALTLNAAFGFPALLISNYLTQDKDWSEFTGVYTAVLFTWAAAAGIRQWGKSNGEP